MERYICIHGHFYQPPRENPWLEAVELQDSAYPYHDWNERITAECYAPNATSRILDEKGRIIQMVNNYVNMSFNFGPTLLAWMQTHSPDVYDAVLEADRQSQALYSGHGSALAQAYNHLILPLATTEHKSIQVLWGIRDFEHRFKRSPEGMWLPETAVDLETLEVLAQQDIRFTILAPHQARRVRAMHGADWEEVREGKIDTTMPYLLNLPSGRSIVLFFYHGPISRAVAFEKLLSSGEAFAQRLVGAFSEEGDRPQMVHIATDGESYGHHHRFGDMALAYALHQIRSRNLARMTNYGEYMEKYPPAYEVEIAENTSWSCAHGLERWRSDCGCHTGSHPQWRQAWRAPLREALDWLRDRAVPVCTEKASSLLRDPQEALKDYIQVVLDRSTGNVEAFFSAHARHDLTGIEKTTVLKLLELQRHVMLMYTSCGWFFDELSGIETLQILRYAGRVLQLAAEVLEQDLEPPFLDRLARAESNLPEQGNGRDIYERHVRPAMTDLKKVAAHYAMCSLFKENDKQPAFYCYMADQEHMSVSEAGRVRLLTGKARFLSRITQESALLRFAALHLGDHNLTCGVKEHEDEETYEQMAKDLSESFARADFTETIRGIDRHFQGSTYSLKSLFRDEESRILGIILESVLEEAEAVYRQLYESHAPLLRFFKDAGLPPPKALHMTAEFVINASLRRALGDETFDPLSVKSLLEEAKEEGVGLDAATLEFAVRKTLERLAEEFFSHSEELDRLQRLAAALELLRSLPFQVNLWRVQNLCYETLKTQYAGWLQRAEQGEEGARNWVRLFRALCEGLSIHAG